MKTKLVKYILTVLIAFIFVQSLFFKFSGSYETQYIFSTLGAWSGFIWFGHYGAYLIGTFELIASILLFTRWHGLGALLSMGIMTGAIFFHLFTPLGTKMPEYDAMGNVVGNDGGELFILACLVWLSSGFLAIRDTLSVDGILNKMYHKNKHVL
ncbi:hypothetical protein [Marinomonas spartinae]|uniref:hypothetical protein n=1 Tax=Marinomonas spartinae TaxID=1792290 RepID=UPI0018F11A02|nr:hypothetical protein [Marinomonas spartinae]MBJ7556520.1 hypothetical protein [Marinomonas spartinae]